MHIKICNCKKKKHSSTNWVIALHLHSHLMGQATTTCDPHSREEMTRSQRGRSLARGHTNCNGRAGFPAWAFPMVHGLGCAQIGTLKTSRCGSVIFFFRSYLPSFRAQKPWALSPNWATELLCGHRKVAQPLWHGCIYWVDILAGVLWFYWPTHRLPSSLSTPRRICVMC